MLVKIRDEVVGQRVIAQTPQCSSRRHDAHRRLTMWGVTTIVGPTETNIYRTPRNQTIMLKHLVAQSRNIRYGTVERNEIE